MSDAIFIAGYYRSGTSALSGALQRLGRHTAQRCRPERAQPARLLRDPGADRVRRRSVRPPRRRMDGCARAARGLVGARRPGAPSLAAGRDPAPPVQRGCRCGASSIRICAASSRSMSARHPRPGTSRMSSISAAPPGRWRQASSRKNGLARAHALLLWLSYSSPPSAMPAICRAAGSPTRTCWPTRPRRSGGSSRTSGWRCSDRARRPGGGRRLPHQPAEPQRAAAAGQSLPPRARPRLAAPGTPFRRGISRPAPGTALPAEARRHRRLSRRDRHQPRRGRAGLRRGSASRRAGPCAGPIGLRPAERVDAGRQARLLALRDAAPPLPNLARAHRRPAEPRACGQRHAGILRAQWHGPARIKIVSVDPVEIPGTPRSWPRGRRRGHDQHPLRRAERRGGDGRLRRRAECRRHPRPRCLPALRAGSRREPGGHDLLR